MEELREQPQVAEKTFTQSELDAIVGERLNRERAKYADYDDIKSKAAKYDETVEASKSELQKATERATSLQAELDSVKKQIEVRDIRAKVATEKGIPVSLLNGDTEEDCIAQADAILQFAQPQGYPAVKDAGENPHPVNTMSTRSQFAEWAEKAFG